MKKDFTRDYATAAFRMWASSGCPSYAEAVEKIKKRVKERGRTDSDNDTEAIEAELEKKSAELCDIMACEETFAVLDGNRRHISEAVRQVYMVDPLHEPKRGELSARVLKYALDVPASEVQVYRWLRSARELFCVFRGLRVIDDDT